MTVTHSTPEQAKADAAALLSVLDPDVLWAVFQQAETAVNRAVYPEVIVFADELDDYWSDEEDEPGTELDSGAPVALACPRCAATYSICEVDVSERWNAFADDVTLNEDGTMTVGIRSEDANHQSLTYMCRRCVMPVGLPEWLDPSWG